MIKFGLILIKHIQQCLKLNFFPPSKGWSSGPTALWLASQHGSKQILILGLITQVKMAVITLIISMQILKITKNPMMEQLICNWPQQTATTTPKNTSLITLEL